MATDEQFARDLERATQLAAQLRPGWLELPGVVGVGSGAERCGGRLTGRAAIVVVVRQKLADETLHERGMEPLPEAVEGIPVDVAQLGEVDEDPETRQAFARAMEQKRRISASVRAQPNVTGVGVGYKVTEGRVTGVIAIQVFVREKLSSSELEARDLAPVPDEYDGVPTDVVQAGPFTHTESPSGSRGDRQDPLRGGLSVGYAGAPFHYGTLGAVVFDNGDRPMVLSNEHVLDGDIGDTVHQPSPVGLDDSFEIGFQLDVCNPLNFVRIDTPDTLGGSILAGAAAASALAAALSDEIDPTREGQQATPPGGALTLEEYTKVEVKYPVWPLPGTAFDLTAHWRYERRTDAGVLQHEATPARQNRHHLRYHRLFTDRRRYSPDDVIRLFGIVIPPSTSETPLVAFRRRIPCKYYHCVALLRPSRLDQSHPVALRVLDGPGDAKLRELIFRWLQEQDLSEEERALLVEHRQTLCCYYGEYPASGLPLGPWKHWMFVQTTNLMPPGTDPLVAAQLIGGLPVSNHYRSTVDVACGPFVFDDDGSFDIELISI